MASIIQNTKQSVEPCNDLAKLSSHPMFEDLQATLMNECFQANVPYTLCSDHTVASRDAELVPHPSYAAVHEATLQQQFLEMSSKMNPKVQELRTFYNTQIAEIETQRLDAVAKMKLSPFENADQYMKEISRIHEYHDRQRSHLTNRVYSSLQLLKISVKSNTGTSLPSRPRSRQLNSKATSLMSDWFEKNIEHPYPSDSQKELLAKQGGITVSQVKAWFANKRNRTSNTKPKKQKIQVEKKLLTICSELTGNNSKQPRVYSDIIQQLSDIVNGSTIFNQNLETADIEFPTSSSEQFPISSREEFPISSREEFHISSNEELPISSSEDSNGSV